MDLNSHDSWKRDSIAGMEAGHISSHYAWSSFPKRSGHQVWNISEFAIPSLSASYNSSVATGFTVRICFKITKEDLSSKQGIV